MRKHCNTVLYTGTPTCYTCMYNNDTHIALHTLEGYIYIFDLGT